MSERGKNLGSHCGMFQSALAPSEVWISTHATVRTQGYHRIRKKPQDEGSVLGSERRWDSLAPTPGITPKGHWHCLCLFYLISFIWGLPPKGKCCAVRVVLSSTVGGTGGPPLSWSQVCPRGVALHVSLALLLTFTSHKIWIGPI